MSFAKLRLGILGSGKGSNLEALADAAARADAPFEIVLVISDVSEALLLEKARKRAIAAEYLAPGPFRTKLDDESEQRYINRLRQAKVDFVALAGFMRILKGEFLRAFPHQVINIHPALLPSFPGLEAWKQALDYGVKVTGCTVHFIDQGVDTGPIIAQQTVPVLDHDTPQSLHARIQEAERILYPETVHSLATGKVIVQGRRCVITPGQDDRR